MIKDIIVKAIKKHRIIKAHELFTSLDNSYFYLICDNDSFETCLGTVTIYPTHTSLFIDDPTTEINIHHSDPQLIPKIEQWCKQLHHP